MDFMEFTRCGLRRLCLFLMAAGAVGCTRASTASTNDASRCAKFGEGAWVSDDIVVTQEDTPITLDVLSNDCDIGPNREIAALTIDSVTPGAIGAAQIIGGNVVYIPRANEFGADTLSYRVHTPGGSTAPGQSTSLLGVSTTIPSR